MLCKEKIFRKNIQLPVLPLLKKRFNVMYLSVEWSTLTGQVTMVQIGPNFSSYYLLCVTF